MLSRLASLWRNLVQRKRVDAELEEELRGAFDLLVDEKLRSGASLEEARRAARLELGSLQSLQEDVRDVRTGAGLDVLLQDARFALRQFRRAPVFTAVAILTLALSIGANVVVFGVLTAVLRPPIDVRDPQSLYQIRHKQWMAGKLLTTSYPAFEDFRQRNTTFSEMAAYYGYSRARFDWRNAVTKAFGYEVTLNYFDLLGVQPELGRFFHAADEPGAAYVVLSDTLWRTAFAADAGVVGTTVALDKRPFTVLGVAPEWFHGTERFVWPKYWIPLVRDRSDPSSRARTLVTVIGRTKPGVTRQQATDNLNAIAAALAREYPATDEGVSVRLIHPGLLGDNGEVIRGFLFGVTALALLVLAAACANLATLFAARASDRGRELALRVALGSSRRRLVGQLLTEAVVVSLLGGAVGFATAVVLLGVLNRWQPPSGGHLAISVDARVYLAGLVLTLGSALLFGIVPARQAWRSSPIQMIKSGPLDSGTRRLALRDLLLGAQIAICTLLVTAALVAVRGLGRVLETPLGFRPQGASIAEVDLGETEDRGDRALESQKAMLEAARSVPGVTAAGAASRMPMTGGIRGIPVYRPGTTELTLKNQVLAAYAFQISPGYLEAAGTERRSGRDVSWHDTTSTPSVAIVNETFARAMWGDAPALGQRFLLRDDPTEVVGVAENGKYHNLPESPQPAVYLPLSQGEPSGVVFVVRSQRPPSELAAALQRAFRGVEPGATVVVRSWPDALAYELFPAQVATAALGVMGLLAAMLALTGIFGMAAYSVSRRMKELGIRVALGARKTQVMSAAVGRPLLLLGAGSGFGLLAGILASRLLERIVYQANPSDPAVVCGAVLTMALLGVAASAIPASRALAVDPARLMREE